MGTLMFCSWSMLARLSRLVRIIPSHVSANMSSANIMNPIENSIKEKLSADLNPLHLDIINESYMHNVPRGSETHFKVVVVSDKFEKLSLLQAKTPEQWEESTKTVEKSPACKGGFGR